MPNPANVIPKGTLFVGLGGGSAPEQLPIGAPGSYLTADPDEDLGVKWAGNIDAAVTGPNSAVSGNLPSFNGASGDVIQDSGIAAAEVVIGPATVVSNAMPRFNGTVGTEIEETGIIVSDSDLMTFPADAGTVYTAGSRKGSFTLTLGTHTKILTTAALADSIIHFTIVSLGTVTEAQAMLCTIDPGVGFTPVSADATDTSTINWAILA